MYTLWIAVLLGSARCITGIGNACGVHRVPGNAIYMMDERTIYGISASKNSLENEALGHEWFRLHVVVLNDPGRLLAVHLVHTRLAPVLAVSMVGYE